MILITQSVTGGGLLQTNSGSQVTGVYHLDFLSVVRMHLHDTADSLLLALGCVVYVGTCLQSSGVYTEECQLTNKRVSNNLECKCGKRSLIAGVSFILFSGIRVNTLDSRNVQWGWHVVYDTVQHHLNTLVLVCGSAEHREHLALQCLFTDCGLDLVDSDFFTLKILHHEFLVTLCNRLNQLIVPYLSLFQHVFRNIYDIKFGSKNVSVIYLCLHGDQVDDTYELVLCTDWHLNRNGIRS